MPAGVLEAGFSDYLKAYTDTPAPAWTEDREGRRRQPFLRRSLLRPPQPDIAPEDLEIAILEGSRLNNGLECKISSTTSKVRPALPGHLHLLIGY